MTRIACVFAAALACTSPAIAVDLTVRVSGIADAAGSIRVAVCTEAEFLKTCRLSASAAARVGGVEVRVLGVAPGRYALQAFHDRDGDGRLASGIFGIPAEPFGFSRAPAMRFGPPSFTDAAVEIGGREMIIPVALRS